MMIQRQLRHPPHRPNTRLPTDAAPMRIAPVSPSGRLWPHLGQRAPARCPTRPAGASARGRRRTAAGRTGRPVPRGTRGRSCARRRPGPARTAAAPRTVAGRRRSLGGSRNRPAARGGRRPVRPADATRHSGRGRVRTGTGRAASGRIVGIYAATCAGGARCPPSRSGTRPCTTRAPAAARRCSSSTACAVTPTCGAATPEARSVTGPRAYRPMRRTPPR